MDLSSFGVRATAGTLRASEGDVLHHTWTAEGVVASSAGNGGQLFHLSVAHCVLNDSYREAARLGVQVDGVAVEVRQWRDEHLRRLVPCLILRPMGVIEFEVERTVKAPIHDVFARLSDINGHNEWMPKKGSIFRHTQQTSAGEPALGTTFLDETVYGPTPGEIVGFHAPHTLVYHWWDSSRSGKLKAEGWPGYSLETADEGMTLVRHHARMHTYSLYRLATPIFRRIAVRERTATVDALKASFESSG